MSFFQHICILAAHTIIVAVQTVEHKPQPLLMSPQVLGELLEVQQAIVVHVTLKDYLWGRRETVSGSAGRKDGLKWMEQVEVDAGGRCVQMRM